MNEINISTLNLNLLRVLEALLDEGSVSKAADRLCLTQPAASHALNRLRYILKDEILVRGRGGMTLTAKAESLKPEIKELMKSIERFFVGGASFDPLKDLTTFRLGFVGEYGDYVLLPRLMHWLTKNQSPIKIEVKHLIDSEAIDALEAAEIDLALGGIAKLPKSIEALTLTETDTVCVVRKSHPLARQKQLRINQYLDYGHVHTRYHDIHRDESPIDRALKQLGKKRDVRLTVDLRVGLPDVILQSDLIATVSRTYAHELAHFCPIVILPCPIELPKLTSRLYRHRRDTCHPAIAWLFDWIARGQI